MVNKFVDLSKSIVGSNPLYLSCLTKSTSTLTTSDGAKVDVWELVTPSEELLKSWANAFRQNYCPDAEIDKLREGTGLSRKEYLAALIFPDKSTAPGPGIRSGDFAELLISDYVEHILKFWVPRTKYAEKASRNESVKGVDILGFYPANYSHPKPDDTLIAFEVKAQLSQGKYQGRLQAAIDDSSKDFIRRAETLNATKRRLINNGEEQKSLLVQRFQNLADHPYKYKSGAAAVLSDEAYDEALIESSTKVANHENFSNLELMVIKGSELMVLVHALYDRAADEA